MFQPLIKSESVRNISILVAGTGMAQAIALGVSPVLSRVFTPDDFGFWAIFVSVTGIFGVISALRYEMAIVLPEREEDARAVLWLSLLVNIAISGILVLLVFFFGGAFIKELGIENFHGWLFLTPLVVFLMGIYNSFNYWTTRHRRFRLNAGARISQSSATAITNLGVGFVRSGAAGLILGQLLGVMSSALYFLVGSLRKTPELKKFPGRSQIIAVARKYRNFPLVNTPHAFVSTMQDSGIVFVIKYFFSTAILGSYSFAFRVLKAPVGLIGSSVFQVFFERAAKTSAEGKPLRPLMWRLHKNLVLLGIPPFLILFLFAPDIFAFVFSEPYRQAGEIARVFTPWLFLNFLVSPVSSITLIKNRQKEAFLITFVDVVLRFGAIVYGGISGNYMLAFTIMSAACSVVLLLALIWYYRIADNRSGDAYQVEENL